MRQDLRAAFRALRRAPTFTIVAILTLTLAIGSSTAMFSVVDAILVRGLPYAAPARLQVVFERSDAGASRVPSYPTFRDWQAQAADLRDVIDGLAFIRGDGVVMPGANGPRREIAAYVTPGFFSLLGTKPVLGRAFSPDDEKRGAPPVAVISYAYFMKHFGGDRRIVGRTIPIDSIPTTVIGVMPRGVAYPNFAGIVGWLPPAVWQPIAVFEASHQALSLRGLHVDSRAILRLRAGADSAKAVAAMRTIAQRLAIQYPVEQAHWTGVQLQSISSEMFGQLPSMLLMISGAIGLVLLLACANVANLLLIRSSARGRELAVRSALGAGSWRIARHLLVEAGVLAFAAGGAGVALSALLLRFMRPYASERLPFATDIAIDARAIAAAIGLSTITALLIGVLPALHARRGDLVSRLRGGPASGAGGVEQQRARDALVVVQVALAVTVLIGAGLLLQSVRRLSAVPLGYDRAGLIEFSLGPPRGRYGAPQEAAALYQRIINAVRAVPTVESVAAAGGALLPTKVETDARRGSSAVPEAAYHPISADYLSTMKVRVVEGRGFTEDDMRSPAGFLISETLAKQLWPQGGAVDQRITVRRSSQARADFGQPITLPVIGVVANYRQFGAEQPPPAQVFLPYTLEVWPWMNFVARSPRAAAILPAVAAAIKSVEPALDFRGEPSVDEKTLTAALSDPRVFVTTLLAGFATTALLLAAIGLYGIVAYGVTQRTRELGIRIAIGATSRTILVLIMRHAAILAAGGVLVGLGTAALLTKTLQSLLFETSTTDPGTLVVVPILLAIVAMIASLIPAIRATRTDPAITMRAE